jgi:hypothetical protein
LAIDTITLSTRPFYMVLEQQKQALTPFRDELPKEGEFIECGESAYGIAMSGAGEVRLRSHDGRVIPVSGELGMHIYGLMLLQYTGEKKLAEMPPESRPLQRWFGGMLTRTFPWGAGQDWRNDPIPVLLHTIANSNCHWTAETLLPEKYYSAGKADKRCFSSESDIVKSVQGKEVPWVGQVYSRREGRDEQGREYLPATYPEHSFIAFARDGERVICVEKIGYGASFRIVPLHEIYYRWTHELHRAPETGEISRQPMFSFSE